MHNPLNQFLIKPIIPIHIAGIDISFTNSALFMVLTTLIIILVFTIGTKEKSLIPGKLQAFTELFYKFIKSMVEENIGDEGKRFFNLIFSIFTFIFFGNLIGMFPFSFTFTSHIIVTFFLALVIFITTVITGFYKQGTKFLKIFLPENVPIIIIPIILPVEFLSYFFRPISLSVRLFANMFAGHIVLKIFANFTVALGVFGILPLLLNVIFIGFEFFIAGLQAYIFTILSCAYINEALKLH